MTLPSTMHAVVVHDDDNRTLAWESVPCPEPGPGDVLVRIHASALNRADLLQRRGFYPPPPGASEIMGLEMAGEIVAVGENVSNWNVGDRVCCLLEGGGYAQYTVCDQRMLLPVPEGLSWLEAAALPEVFYTAYLNLFMEAKAQPGETVLVHAGASGVGTAAIQLCKAKGNRVLATASENKLEALRVLGADAVFDRHQGSFLEWVKEETDGKGVDVILDPVGASYLEDNLKSLCRDGRLVLIGLLGGRDAEISLGTVLLKRIRLIGSTLRSRSREAKVSITDAIQKDIWPLFSASELKPIIHQVFPVADVAEAHALMESNVSVGKIMLEISHDE